MAINNYTKQLLAKFGINYQPLNAASGNANQQKVADSYDKYIEQMADHLQNTSHNDKDLSGARTSASQAFQNANNYMGQADNLAKVDPSGNLLNKAINGQATDVQALNQALSSQGQLDSQNQQLGDFRNNLSKQYFGAQGPINLNDALSSTGGQVGQLNQFLGKQTADTFNTQLKPLIQMALGAQGLSDSGAQVELQSKALAGLQQNQQQSLMQAALGAQNQINNLDYSQVQGNIAGQQTNLNNQYGLQQAGITIQFQQQLQDQQRELAQQLAAYRGSAGGGGIGSMIGGGLGAVAGGLMGGPAGAMAGYGMGSSLGGGIGNSISPGYSGNGMGNSGSSFFAASSMMPKTWGSGGGGMGQQYSGNGQNPFQTSYLSQLQAPVY